MRISNADTLISHGNLRGRAAMLRILEAGLQAADPYNNVLKLVRIESGKLIVGNKDFEPFGDPRTGDTVYDLSAVGNIYVFGGCKGVQHIAKALEDILGDRLTGGHVIGKHGDDIILDRIEVTLGAHPVPDEHCVQGCKRILELAKGLTKDDLVFTISGNGVSSLLTLPVPGVSLEDVRKTTYIMQIERGAPTGDLNPVRNHLDVMKGGKMSRYFLPARVVHIAAAGTQPYEQLMHHNVWHHTLPGSTTYETAIANLKRWHAWEEVPASVRTFLEKGDPQYETVKAEEFETFPFRVFEIMPYQLGMVPTARQEAAELGLRPVTLASGLQTEASQAGLVVATIARTIESRGEPFEPPCALFTHGELVVTVGKEEGIGGRNQEYALAAALRIAGSANIVVGAVDSDGTDGPGTQFHKGPEGIPSLAGGIVDGETVAAAERMGVDIREALRRHDASPALWKLGCGIVATHNISMNDLGVTLILGRS